MTHTLTITLADAADLRWAQTTVTAAHYLRAPVDPRARPMLGDVFPCSTALDGINVAIADPVIVSDCLERFASLTTTPDLHDLSGGKFSERVIFAQGTPSLISALSHLVVIIILGCAKPKMVRIDARWHVALMAHSHTFDKWPVVDFVAEPVGADVLPVLGEDTVTLTVLSASPQPAFIVAALVYVAPKLVNQGALASIESTVTIDVLQWLTLHPSQGFAVTVCDRRLLSTATHAKAARVRNLNLQVLGFVVAWEEPGGVSFAVSLGEIGAILDRRSLTTAALALPVGIPQSVLSNPRGIFVKVCRERGGGDMISHVIRSFQRLTKPWDVDASPGHLYLLQDYFTTFPKFRQLYVMSSRQVIPTWQDLDRIKPRTLRLI